MGLPEYHWSNIPIMSAIWYSFPETSRNRSSVSTMACALPKHRRSGEGLLHWSMKKMGITESLSLKILAR